MMMMNNNNNNNTARNSKNKNKTEMRIWIIRRRKKKQNWPIPTNTTTTTTISKKKHEANYTRKQKMPRNKEEAEREGSKVTTTKTRGGPREVTATWPRNADITWRELRFYSTRLYIVLPRPPEKQDARNGDVRIRERRPVLKSRGTGWRRDARVRKMVFLDKMIQFQCGFVSFFSSCKITHLQCGFVIFFFRLLDPD